MALRFCPDCRAQVSPKAAACPSCGRPLKARPVSCLVATLVILAAVVIFGAILSAIIGSSGSERAEQVPAPTPTMTAEQQAQAKAKHDAEIKAAADREKKWLSTKAGRIWSKHKIWDRSDCEAIAKGRVSIGMTSEQVLLAWGSPTANNRTTSDYGVHEQWCYGEFCNPAVYIEDGIVRSIQD